MRICYIGHFLDGTGYGYASASYIEALDHVGVEVIAIPYRLNKRNLTPSNTIFKCMGRKIKDAEMVILHTLPAFFDKHSTLPSVGVFSTEMSGIPQNWVDNINYMTDNIVSSPESMDCCVNSGAKAPYVLPYCFDLQKFDNFERIDFIDDLKKDGKKIFYTVGEFVNRKNFSAMLRAYYTEFSKEDNVHLIIKSTLSGQSAKDLGQLFQMKNHDIVKGLNLKKDMPEVTFLPYYMEENEIYSLHNNCDIYISTSYGESFDLCAFAAMACGKTPIVPDYYKCIGYMSDKEGFLTKSHVNPCFGLIDGDPSLYNSNFNFHSVDINDLRQKMRFALSSDLREKSMSGIEKSKEFSYGAVGEKFRKVLENVKKI